MVLLCLNFVSTFIIFDFLNALFTYNILFAFFQTNLLLTVTLQGFHRQWITALVRITLPLTTTPTLSSSSEVREKRWNFGPSSFALKFAQILSESGKNPLCLSHTETIYLVLYISIHVASLIWKFLPFN